MTRNKWILIGLAAATVYVLYNLTQSVAGLGSVLNQPGNNEAQVPSVTGVPSIGQ